MTPDETIVVVTFAIVLALAALIADFVSKPRAPREIEEFPYPTPCPEDACDGSGKVERLDEDGYPTGYYDKCPCRL